MTAPPSQPPQKICTLCKRDCSQRARTKDAQGRYVCQACVDRAAAVKAPEVDDAPIPLAEPVEPVRSTPPKACPSCARRMGEGSVICANCGYDERKGLQISAAAAGSRPRKGAGGAQCPSCGYDITGLRKAECPECGGLISLKEIERHRKARENARAYLWAYLSPVLMLVIGLAVAAGAAWSRTNDPADLVATAILWGIRVVVALVVYCLCASIWMGFAAPLLMTTVQMAGVIAVMQALLNLVDAAVPPIFMRSFYGAMAIYGAVGLVTGGILAKVMDVEVEDAWIMMPLIILGSLILPLIILVALRP